MATTSPTEYDPEALFQGTLTTTLDATLVTAAAEAGIRILSIVLVNTTSTVRAVTIDHYDGGTGYKICSTMDIPTGGSPIIIEADIILDASDLLRGGASANAAIDCNVYGIRLAD